ncbi:hypothetical protein LOTGIDRAFT_235779 [Lottia gigantea]|uniref:AAA+ ATPase domain-containing protein n=1 Tax=Lottia gigantea TaxID=225164 RepID=V4BA80_LOTGI|nr:hypothetical protein LOTGIDRAFT_235779 [Lottia gigantea]ESO85829.1 hypothetical protein LOTGIDRAFT_235779 [Lottia gigantea]
MASASVLNKGESLNKLPVLEDELQSPQRSITDFFKSPPSKQKSKNLSHVFFSTPKEKCTNVQPNLLSKKKNISLCEEIGSPIVENIKKKTLKEDENKVIVVENEESTNRKDIANKSGISRRVKTKKKKKNKKVNDSLDDQFIQHFDSIHVKSDTSTDDVNILINSASSVTKSENIQNSSKISDLKSEECEGIVGKTSLKSVKHKAKEVLKNSEQNSQNNSCGETKNDLKSKVNTRDENSTENSSVDKPALKSKRKRSTDGEVVENKNKKSKLTTKKEQTKTSASSKEPQSVEEIETKSVSYEDYLKDLPVDSTTTDIFDVEAQPTDFDDTGLLVPDDYPSVEKYFGKNAYSPENVKAANNSLTITVDVHQEPTAKEGVFDLFKKGSNKKKTREKSDNPIILSPNSSYISVDDDEIVFISSEIQEVEVDQSKPRSKITKADVQVTESPKPKPLQISKESEDFLKSNEKTVAPTKTAQATLCFTEKGLKTDVKNIVKEPLPLMPDIDAIPAAEPAEKSQKPCKKKLKKIDADIKESENLTDKNQQQKKTKKFDSAKEQEEKKQKRKKMKKSKANAVIEEKPDINDKLFLNEMNNNETSKKKKRKYKVTSLQFDDSKRTPIKMKIKCRKSLGGGNSSLEENEFTPKSSKQCSKKDSAKKLLVKAQEILVKAKKQKTKKTTEKKTAKTPKTSHLVNRRSSPRLASKPSISLEEVIDIDDDDDDTDDVEIVEEKVKKTKAKSRKVNATTDTPTKSTKPQVSTPVKSTKAKFGTPVKSTKVKIGTPVKTATPKKGTGKVASIFNVKKKQDKNEPEIVKPPEDPEKVKQRQAFLSSGIPDVVKKQHESSASQVIALPEYPPFPKDSHIQQLSSSYRQTITNLSIKLLKPPQYTGCNITWSQLQLTNLYKQITSATNSYFTNFKHHETISEDICMKLLEEIKETNPVYPAQLMYESLKTKRLDELNTLKLEETAVNTKLEEPVVITLDDDNDVIKVKKKSKLKRKKEKRKSVEEIKEPEPEKPPLHASSELLWTDKYQPSHSSDIIGNTSDINKLKTWLLEWKHKTHKDARKMKKLLSKQSKSSKSSSQDSQWYKDDSDFDSDESEEDDRLCNTMLITGQHGIGKTATVYALAQELGYKVFEVNTSSSRNGKKILARLQEATQSHQVAQNKDGIAPPVFGSTDSPLTPRKDIKNKLPKAFNNLFNKAKKVETKETETDSKNDKKEKSNTCNKKRKREDELETESQVEKKAKKKIDVDDHLERMSQLYHKDDSNQAGGLNLTSTSVILFDEVDLVFDKDQGFMSAIQYFMSTTKIPIILTTTNKNVANLIQARLEIIQFYPPTQRLIASHLQTICLVEGVRCQYKDLLYLVRYYNNDVRRCILAVQLWLESGASPIQHQYQHKIKSAGNTITSHHIDSDEEDFVQSKPRSNRRILDDDESNSSTVDKDTPLIHSLCFESVLGLTNKLHTCIDTHVSSFLQENFSVEKLNSTLYCCELLRTLRFNLLHHNILHLVPLPQTCLTKYKPTPVNSTVIKHRRILDSEDYDSETSNNEPPETVKKQSRPKSNESKKEKRYISKCLSSFSTYYDNMCLLDNLQTSFNLKDLDNPVHTTRIKDVHEPSLIDVQTTYQNSYSWLHNSHTDIMNHIEARSCQMLCEEIQDIYLDIEKKNTKHDESFLDKLSLPVENGATKFQVSHKHRKHEKGISEAHDNIISTLPPSSARRNVSLDYIPYLRTIHQTECLKKIEKAKRRFHHHFDNIGFGLKRSTLSYLDKSLD